MRCSAVVHTFRHKGKSLLTLEGLQWRFGEGDRVQINDDNFRIISIRHSFSVVQSIYDDTSDAKMYVEYSLEKVKEKAESYY